MQPLNFVVGSAQYEAVSDAVCFRAHDESNFIDLAVTRRALERLEGSNALDPMQAVDVFQLHRDVVLEVAVAHYLRMRFVFGRLKLTEEHFGQR